MAKGIDGQLTRRGFLGMAAATAGTLAFGQGAKGARPNLVCILTDDQRWDALRYMGNTVIETPNLDKLAAQGVTFENNFATTAICMSSRASILTGLHTATHGLDDFAKPLPDTLFAQSYPGLLRANGYFTGFVGKWGLGGDLPQDEFDVFDGFPGQGQYFLDKEEKVHLTQSIGTRALDFLQSCPKDKPFCLSLSTKAPHVQDADPRQFLYDKAYESLYGGVEIPTPPSATADDFEAQPEFIRDSENRTRWDRRFATDEMYQDMVKGYYRLITGLDAMVGRVLNELERLGIADNTVVVFTSDHGFFLGEHGLAGKWLMYEESIRSPLIISGPGIASGLRGRRVDPMALNIDVAPTLLDFAGIDRPVSMQGRSLRPIVEGAAPAWRDEWFYDHLYGHNGRIAQSQGIRTDRWKYIRYVGETPFFEQLFDLEADPHEQRNLAGDAAHAERLETMRARWQIWRDALASYSVADGGAWQDPK